jgi:hypothetical protein
MPMHTTMIVKCTFCNALICFAYSYHCSTMSGGLVELPKLRHDLSWKHPTICSLCLWLKNVFVFPTLGSSTIFFQLDVFLQQS